MLTEPMLEHYLQTGSYTDLGLYRDVVKRLPDNIKELGLLVRMQVLHRMVLKNGNTGSNFNLKYGDMRNVPWYRQPQDDIFPTASAIVAELYRLDSRGFILDRAAENKPILTCRATAVLMASILKTKGVPARVRSGFAPYFVVEGLPVGKSDGHWVNQYWNRDENCWVTIDVDGSLEPLVFDPYNIPEGTFDFSADAWLAIRSGKTQEDHFYNSGGTGGLIAVSWELFYDFHCLMNDELIYQHTPEITHFGKFPKLTQSQLLEIDQLAQLMQDPDKNLQELKNIWQTKREFRLVKGGVI